MASRLWEGSAGVKAMSPSWRKGARHKQKKLLEKKDVRCMCTNYKNIENLRICEILDLQLYDCGSNHIASSSILTLPPQELHSEICS